MDGKETPITKYLANLERRKSIYSTQLPSTSSPSPSPPTFGFGFPSTTNRLAPGRQMRINFDDTFFTRDDDDESILHVSPLTNSAKRRRTSALFSDDENVEEMQKKISELERLLRQTQSELIDGRAAYTKLDQVNNDMRRAHNEKLIALEKSNEELKLKSRNSIDRAESMEKQLARMQKKDSERGDDYQTQATSQLNKIAKLEEKVANLSKENQMLSQKLTEESIAHEQALQSINLKFEASEKLSTKSSHEADVTQRHLNEVTLQLRKAQEDLKNSHSEIVKYEEFKQKYEASLAAQEASSSDLLVLQERVRKYENLFVKEQIASQKMAKAMAKLKDENEILNSTPKREHLLQEELLSAESEISVLKTQLRDKAIVEGERDNLRSEVKAWVAVATKLDASCRTALAFGTLFRKNQDLLLQLKLENTTLKHTNENNTKLISVMEGEVIELKKQLKTLSDEKDELSLNLRRTSRRMNLIIQDRDGLRELTDSYEKELSELITESLKARVAQLESIVKEYELTIAEDDSLRKRVCDECKNHTTVIELLQTELAETKEDKEKLSQTLAEFNTTVSEDPTTGLKIVSFGNNPSMLSIEARLKECIAENIELKAKLQGYENDTMMRAPDEDLLAEKRVLEDKLKTLERKHEILTESYDFESVQLQSACSKLFGYYVTLTRAGAGSPAQFRLQSVYSAATDDFFIFQEGESGEMLLLDTPILAHFQDDIDRFLRQEFSVPSFLSAVTFTYAQGANQQESQSSVQDNDDSIDAGFAGSGNQTTIQVMTTESLTQGGHGSSSREVQIEVEGENGSSEEDDYDEEEDEDDGSGEDEYDDEDDMDADDRVEEEERDDDDDDDIVVLD